MKDLYYILGVEKTATPAEIDNAYSILSAKLKPAEGGNDHFLQNHFNEISDAYAIVGNPAKRNAYDATLKRNHLKQIARFKAKTTNAFIAVAVLLVAGLFGFYVVNLINSHKGVTKVVATDAVVVVQAPKKHHKRKHHTKALIARSKPISVVPKKTTVISPSAPALAVTPAVKLNPDKVKEVTTKPAYAALAKPLAVKKDSVKLVKPVVAEAPIKHLILVKSTTQRDTSYITYLKNNLRDSVYLHQLADYMSPVVSVLAANAKVRVLEKGRTFYKVALSSGTGYVPKWTLVKP